MANLQPAEGLTSRQLYKYTDKVQPPIREDSQTTKPATAGFDWCALGVHLRGIGTNFAALVTH